MDEKSERKLHPIIEILIIVAVILVCNIAWSFGFSLFTKRKNYDEISAIYSAMSWFKQLIGLIVPVLATLLCVKVVEKRKVGIVKVLIIALCISLFLSLIMNIISNCVAQYGTQALVSFSYVRVFLTPVLTAILIVVFVNILSAPKVGAYMYDEKMHCGLFKHVLLLFFTFGIWVLMWNYRVTRYLNCVEGEEYRNPATKLLLCMFVPFYSIYWTYKSAQRIDKLAKSVDVVSDLATPCLILGIFVPFVSPILMQDKINKILETSNVPQ